jgi:cell wall-associated NlpC family hydrolase
MNKFFSFLGLILFFSNDCDAALPDSSVIRRLNELSAMVQKKYAPDKRVEFYQLKQQNLSPLTFKLEFSRPESAIELKSLLSAENLPVQINEEFLPSKDLGERTYGIANLSVINTRYGPDHAAEMATQAGLGTPLKVLKKERGHYFVRTPDNYLSWTESAGVTLLTKTEFENWQTAEKLIYTDLYGQAYSEASETSLPVSDLVAGNIMQLISESNGFYKISFPDKRMAYIPVKKARLFDQWKDLPDPGAEEILRTARNFLGIPYLWGGTSVKGMDCSGFTKTSYFLNGIVLPRDASQQALVGEKLDINVADTVDIAKSLKTLKAGDLLFFAANKLTRRVTHTAIYIGNGEFIQAAGLVRINSMIKGAKNYDDFQSRTMVGARRMLTAIGEPEVTRVNKHPYYQRIINQ